jgi:hypothetical protein
MGLEQHYWAIGCGRRRPRGNCCVDYTMEYTFAMAYWYQRLVVLEVLYIQATTQTFGFL